MPSSHESLDSSYFKSVQRREFRVHAFKPRLQLIHLKNIKWNDIAAFTLSLFMIAGAHGWLSDRHHQVNFVLMFLRLCGRVIKRTSSSSDSTDVVRFLYES